MSAYQLAQLNIARMVAPIDSPILADFVANLDRINALAERSPGFVWRLQTVGGDATAISHFGENMLVNMSVWASVQALHRYAYKSAHTNIMRRRKEWFEKMREVYSVLWWIRAGHQPSLVEAQAKLEHLRAHGPSAQAFTFRKPFPAPDQLSEGNLSPLGDTCPAA